MNYACLKRQQFDMLCVQLWVYPPCHIVVFLFEWSRTLWSYKKNTDATGSYMILYNLAKFGTLMKIPLYEDSWSVKIDYPYCIVYSITFFENCYRLSTWIWNLWLCTKFVNSHFKNARITGTRARETRNARQQEAGTRNQEHAICAFYDACVKLRL